MPSNDDPKKKLSGPPQPPHVSDLILNSLKPRTGKETSRWIAGLADDTIREAAETAARDIESAPTAAVAAAAGKLGARHGVVTFMDQLFDFFQQIEFDFNKTVAGTDYVVSIERPTYSNEKVRQRFHAQETVKVFRGRISTRYWTMIMRAHDEIIEGWILPVEQVFGFRADDSTYVQFVSIEPVSDGNGEFNWKVNGSLVKPESARNLAKDLFSSLIRVAKGEMAESSKFSATGDPRHSGQLPPLEEVPPSMRTDTGPACETGSNKPALLSEAPATPVSKPQTRQTIRTQTRANRAAAGEPTLDSVIEHLHTVLDRELQKLSNEGADAFAKQDMPRVERIYKRANRVKELQGQIMITMQQFKAAVKDALEL